MRKTTVIVAMAAALAALSGCDADPTTEDAPEVVETTEDAAEVEEAAADDETDEQTETAPGTRDNPLELGTRALVGPDYEITVTEITLNADEIMADENLFNEPAEVGQYVLVTLEGTFLGVETPEGDPSFDLAAVIVGSDSKQYADFDSFGIPPDALFDGPTLEAGGEFSGNVVLDLPADALDGGQLFIEPLISFDNDSRAFWAIP